MWRDVYATVLNWVCGATVLQCQGFSPFLNTLNRCNSPVTCDQAYLAEVGTSLCVHDHVVLLLSLQDFENLPSWLSKNFRILEGGLHAGRSHAPFPR